MMRLFNAHRLSPDSLYIGKNFGLIALSNSNCSHSSSSFSGQLSGETQSCPAEAVGSPASTARYVEVSIQSIGGIHSRRNRTPSVDFESSAVLVHRLDLARVRSNSQEELSPILRIDYPDFYSCSPPVAVLVVFAMLLVLLLLLRSARKIAAQLLVVTRTRS